MQSNGSEARLHQVASTSARAKRCQFSFDADRLKVSYLDYELRQGATTEQISTLAKSYDLTQMSKFEEVFAKPTYCSDRVTALIKTALERHLAGDFRPTVVDPQIPAATTAGIDAEKPFDASQMWGSQAEKRTRH